MKPLAKRQGKGDFADARLVVGDLYGTNRPMNFLKAAMLAAAFYASGVLTPTGGPASSAHAQDTPSAGPLILIAAIQTAPTPMPAATQQMIANAMTAAASQPGGVAALVATMVAQSGAVSGTGAGAIAGAVTSALIAASPANATAIGVGLGAAATMLAKAGYAGAATAALATAAR